MATYTAPFPDVRVGDVFFVHKYVLAKHARFFRQLFDLLPHETKHVAQPLDTTLFELVLRVFYQDSVPTLNSQAYCDLVVALHELGADALVQQYVREAQKTIPMDASAELYYRIGEEKYAQALLYDRFKEWTSVIADKQLQSRCVQLLQENEMTSDSLWQEKLALREVWTLWALWLRAHHDTCSDEARDLFVQYLCYQLTHFRKTNELVQMAKMDNFLDAFEYLGATRVAKVRSVIQTSILERTFDVDTSDKKQVKRLKMILFT